MAVWGDFRDAPELTDWLTAALITAAAEIEVLLTPAAGHGSSGVRAITSLGLLAIAWRRSLPLVSIAVACASTILCRLTGGWAQDVVPLLTVFLLTYSLGAYAGNLTIVAGACMVALTPLTLHALGPQSGFSSAESLAWVFGVEAALPILVGRLVRGRAHLIGRLREQNAALVKERESQAFAATVEERLRLARHLHGMVAASVEAIIAEVEVAETDSGPRGLEAVAHVETAARQALCQMRGLVLDLASAEIR
ncbi:MAG TPA: histidine kinase dimerization/phosphoacceptor domain-containing protein [Candidatus Dormibacteraeota bacterium]